MSKRGTGFETETVSPFINTLGTDKYLASQTGTLSFYNSINIRRLEKQFLKIYPGIKKFLRAEEV